MQKSLLKCFQQWKLEAMIKFIDYLKKLLRAEGSQGDLSKHRQHTIKYEDLCQ